jgi:hypothetical protein
VKTAVGNWHAEHASTSEGAEVIGGSVGGRKCRFGRDSRAWFPIKYAAWAGGRLQTRCVCEVRTGREVIAGLEGCRGQGKRGQS